MDFDAFGDPDAISRPTPEVRTTVATPERDVTRVATTMQRFEQLEESMASARAQIKPAAIMVALQEDAVSDQHGNAKIADTPRLFVEHHQRQESAEYRRLRARREGRLTWMDAHSTRRQVEVESDYSLLVDDHGTAHRISFQGFGE